MKLEKIFKEAKLIKKVDDLRKYLKKRKIFFHYLERTMLSFTLVMQSKQPIFINQHLAFNLTHIKDLRQTARTVYHTF